MTNSATSVTPVSQDSVVTNTNIEQFVNQYHMCIQKTASVILELANIVYNAKNTLDDSEFQQFRDAIGADKFKDSYIRKLICIAKHSARFNPLSQKLPPNYTTLYSLSKLREDKFQKVIDANIISPDMTAKSLNHFLKISHTTVSAKKKSKKGICISFTLDLQSIDMTTASKLFKEIDALCNEFHIFYECDIDPNHDWRSAYLQNEVFEEKLVA